MNKYKIAYTYETDNQRCNYLGQQSKPKTQPKPLNNFTSNYTHKGKTSAKRIC